MRKPCRVCGRPANSAICTTCKASRESSRPSRSQRGYDLEYNRARAKLRAEFEPGVTRCVICGFVIHNLRDWTCEHQIAIRNLGTSDLANLGPAHAACNYGWRKRERAGP